MTHLKKPDFLEYWTDEAGNQHIVNVFCKMCGTKIQEGRFVKNHLGVNRPVISPLDTYVDLYISFEDKDGVLRRKSTPMCADCAKGELTAEVLEAIHAADTEIMAERHRQSGVHDKEVEKHMEDRKRMRMLAKIGYCVPGYAITGEGR